MCIQIFPVKYAWKEVDVNPMGFIHQQRMDIILTKELTL